MFPTARHASYLKTPQFLLDNVPCHTKSLILFKSPKRNTLWLQKSINHLEIAFWDLSSTGSGPMKVYRAPAEGDSSHVSGGRFQESWRDTNQAYYQASLLPTKPTTKQAHCLQIVDTARTRPSFCHLSRDTNQAYYCLQSAEGSPMDLQQELDQVHVGPSNGIPRNSQEHFFS